MDTIKHKWRSICRFLHLGCCYIAVALFVAGKKIVLYASLHCFMQSFNVACRCRVTSLGIVKIDMQDDSLESPTH